MTDACPAPRCAPVIKRNYFVQINGTAFSNVVNTADCSRGILLLTDDPGFLDVDDKGLGTYLGSDNRIRLIPTFTEAAKHFNPISSTYRDLQCFFGLPNGRGSRPPYIYVGYVNRETDGETLLDGFREIIKCPTCFWNVGVTLYQSDGVTPYVDTVELLDLQAFIRTDKEYDIKVPSFQASLAFADPFETTSQGAVAAAAGSDAEYVISSYYCDVQRNSDNTAFVNPAVGDPDHNPAYAEGENIPEYRYSNDALLVAAIAASYSVVRDASYNWSQFLKPINFGSTSCATGRFLDETTLGDPQPTAIEVTESELINATGINGFTGDLVEGATRHFNAFVNTQNGVTYVESLRVDGSQFADVWYKEKAVNEALEQESILFMSSRHALGLSSKEQRLLAARIGLVLQRFVDKDVINPENYPWAEAGYEDIVVERPGYVVRIVPISDLTTSQITSRNGYIIGVCFLVNEPQHRLAINICETAVDTSLIGQGG